MTKVDIISGFLGARKNYIYQKAAQRRMGRRETCID